ncbi:carboxypeptidase-like regulatory domain-containing protein [Flavobacterium piscinae]|uniref:Carboxypeptidase-like regulatory domain-containing protein n=1 Tax=Flavobacterium piscinae TaxID=2506424 RepID=A0A4Q1KWV8_9FLAO|nr:carboxypeptidase-like regulatory domain-containing protein [Flavobacterium piscinae]RXR34783.1 carboxypeptidase-like regulatory domain-containing protein [Flavobacterium piscinae]
MKRIFFGIILITQIVTSQNILNGKILSKDNNEPISYVNIGIINKDVGTVSDENGDFELILVLGNEYYVNETNEKDSILISSIGFKSQKFTVLELQKKLKETKKIYLETDTIFLNEVVISSYKNLKEEIIGKTHKSKTEAVFKDCPLGYEMGTKIKIGKSPTIVKSFNTYIIKNNLGFKKFRLNFYSIKKGKPSTKLFNKDIIFEIPLKEGDFKLDLEEYDIILKEDCIVTIETLDNDKNGDTLNEISFSAKLLGGSIYYRKTSQGKWKKTKMASIGFNLNVLQ